jgi:4-amino-4-deoxy-L-arabinose transferase-like glycosyltransferase
MDTHEQVVQQRWFYLFIALAVAVNCSGLCIPILGPDGAVYASIAKTMVQRRNYLELFVQGHDWLDKPHFPFWLTALSFRLFGFHTWAYKLPAILCLMMGAWYTYLFAKQFYTRQVALWSVLILLTAEHIILSNNDVRAEPYLTGLIMAAVYAFSRAHHTKKCWPLLLGSGFAACATMTKGPMALIPIGGAVAGELVLKKQWKDLWHIRWLCAAFLILLGITPELYCLYHQFDAHPDKVVFGRTGVSGLRFFFWDSQFGRFMNTGPMKGHGTPTFFLHTTLWAFLPWSVLLYVAIYTRIKTYRRRAQDEGEWYTISGALLMFLVFSASRFQLPHYLNILFPFWAILTAQYLSQVASPAGLRFLTVMQCSMISLLFLLVLLIHLLCRPDHIPWWTWMLVSGLVVLLLFCGRLFRVEAKHRLISQMALAAMAVNCYLNLGMAPYLLKYQAGSEAAFYSNQYYPGIPVVQVASHTSSPLTFYLEQPLTTIQHLADTATLIQRPFLLYAPVEELKGVQGQLVQTFEFFPVSRLTLPFLYYKTRPKETRAYGLLFIQ